MKVYLCGPIANCTDDECKDWRNFMTQLLGENNCIDPMRRDYRGRIATGVEKEVVELDKLDIMMSDALVVNYFRPSVGTSMEILFAWMNHKPIVLVCHPGIDVQDDRELSPWLLYHSTIIVHSYTDAADYLLERFSK